MSHALHLRTWELNSVAMETCPQGTDHFSFITFHIFFLFHWLCSPGLPFQISVSRRPLVSWQLQLLMHSLWWGIWARTSPPRPGTLRMDIIDHWLWSQRIRNKFNNLVRARSWIIIYMCGNILIYMSVPTVYSGKVTDVSYKVGLNWSCHANLICPHEGKKTFW